MTETLKDVIDHTVEQVKAAGITRVTARLEDINPPCAWVALDEVDHQLAAGSMDVRVAVFLIPGGADEYRALDKGGDMLADLLLSDFSPTVPTRTALVQPTETTRPLAALRTGTTHTVTPD